MFFYLDKLIIKRALLSINNLRKSLDESVTRNLYAALYPKSTFMDNNVFLIITMSNIGECLSFHVDHNFDV